MKMIKSLATAGLLAGSLLASAANAVVVPFAAYTSIGAGKMVWTNNGTGNPATRSNGNGGTLTTTTTQVNFQYQTIPILTGLGNLVANFAISGASSGPAMSTVIPGFGTFLYQPTSTVTFSFLSTTAFTVNNINYGIGTNLLSGTFTGGISGKSGSTTGNLGGSSASGDVLHFSSDVVTFANNANFDASISLSAITNVLFRAAGTGINQKGLRSFKSAHSGTFSSDPVPIVNAVPEPEVWALMVVGFGMVGLQVRRRNRQNSVTA